MCFHVSFVSRLFFILKCLFVVKRNGLSHVRYFIMFCRACCDMLKKLSVLLKNVIDVSFRTLTLNLTKMLKSPAPFSFSFSLQQNTFKVGRDDSSWMETFFLKQSCPHNSKYVCFACIVKTPKIELRNRGGSLFPRCSLKMNSSSFRSAPKGYIARFSSNKATFPYVLAYVLSHLIVKHRHRDEYKTTYNFQAQWLHENSLWTS